MTLYQETRNAKRRNLPDETKADFAPKGLQSLIENNGTIDRSKWESALFVKVCDEIVAGNMAVEGAKNFGRFEPFFLPHTAWEQAAPGFWAQTGFPAQDFQQMPMRP